MRTLRPIVIVVFFAIVLPLSADTVLLRTGQTVEGTIISQSRTDIRIQTAAGIQVLQKTNVQRVIYGSDAARVAEEKRLQEERRLEELRKAEEARKAEELRKQEEARKAAEKNKDPGGKKNTTEPAKAGGPSTWSYAWRSMVLPGWGHLYGGETMTGYAYMGAFGVALLGVARTRNTALDAKSTYTSEVTMNKIKGLALRSALGGGTGTTFIALIYMRQADAAVQNDYKKAVQKNKAALGFLGTVYLAQLAHVTIFSPRPIASSDPSGERIQFFAAALPGPDRTWTSVAGLTFAF